MASGFNWHNMPAPAQPPPSLNAARRQMLFVQPQVAPALTPADRIRQYLEGEDRKRLYNLSLDAQKKLAASLNLEALGVLQPTYLQALRGLAGLLSQAQALQPAQDAFVRSAIAGTQNVDPMVIAMLAARRAGQQAYSQGMQHARSVSASNPALASGAMLAAQNSAARARNSVLGSAMDYGALADTLARLAQARSAIVQSGTAQSPIAQIMQLLSQQHGQTSTAVNQTQLQPKQQGGNDLAAVLGTVVGLAGGIKGLL